MHALPCWLMHYVGMCRCNPAGWKALAGTAAAWGRPPSPAVLALVLRGLAGQLQQGLLDEQQLPAVQEVARCAALDLSAASGQAADAAEEQPVWPPLDAPLAEAALQLLLACHAAAAAAAAAASGGPAPAALLEEGGRALLAGLAASRTPLTPALCDVLVAAFDAARGLEDWAAATYGDAAFESILAGALAEREVASPVLPPPRAQPPKPPAVDELAGEPAGGGAASQKPVWTACTARIELRVHVRLRLGNSLLPTCRCRCRSGRLGGGAGPLARGGRGCGAAGRALCRWARPAGPTGAGARVQRSGSPMMRPCLRVTSKSSMAADLMSARDNDQLIRHLEKWGWQLQVRA